MQTGSKLASVVYVPPVATLGDAHPLIIACATFALEAVTIACFPGEAIPSLDHATSSAGLALNCRRLLGPGFCRTLLGPGFCRRLLGPGCCHRLLGPEFSTWCLLNCSPGFSSRCLRNCRPGFSSRCLLNCRRLLGPGFWPRCLLNGRRPLALCASERVKH